jgi:DNA-binding PadR family transcriptional regulator
MRRETGVPRGLLRFLVLKFLAEKPMSGVEIVEEIEQETGGKWKPSSGSIYPLLAWLLDKGYTRESSDLEIGMKRHSLTDKGKKFFEEQVKFGEKLMDKLEWLAPMLIGGFYVGTKNHEDSLVRKSVERVVKTFMEFKAKKNSLTKQDIEETVKILDDSDKQLRKIVERIKDKE